MSFSAYSANGLSISDFIANAKGYYFVADIVNARGTSGLVGAVAPTVVPLPAALPLLGAGLMGLGALRRKRKA